MTLFILLSALILDPAHSCWWRHQGSLQSVSRASSSCASLDSRVAGLTKQLDNLHLPVTPSDSHGRSFNMGERSCVFCLVYLWYSRNNAQPACLTLQTFFSCVIVCSNFESTAQKKCSGVVFWSMRWVQSGIESRKGIREIKCCRIVPVCALTHSILLLPLVWLCLPNVYYHRLDARFLPISDWSAVWFNHSVLDCFSRGIVLVKWVKVNLTMIANACLH